MMTDWLNKDNLTYDVDLNLERKRLNLINLNDNDLNLYKIDLTHDHLDIGLGYNRMTDTELDCGSNNESQHDNALRKLKHMHASGISDWISNDKKKAWST